MIQELTEYINELIGISLALITFLTTYLTYKKKSKEDKIDSQTLLYKQLEELQTKVILSVKKEIESATTIAEKDHIIAIYKMRCENNCADYFDNLTNTENEQN